MIDSKAKNTRYDQKSNKYVKNFGSLILAEISGRFSNEIKVKIKMLTGIKKLCP